MCLPGSLKTGPLRLAADSPGPGRSRAKPSLGEHSPGKAASPQRLWRAPATSKEKGGGLASSRSGLPPPSPAGVVAARGAWARAGDGSPAAAATPRALLGYRRVHSGAGSGNTHSNRPPASDSNTRPPSRGKGCASPTGAKGEAQQPQNFQNATSDPLPSHPGEGDGKTGAGNGARAEG